MGPRASSVSVVRLALLMVASAALVGPVGYTLGELGDRGQVGVGIFSGLMIPVGLLLRTIFNDVEALALGVKQRPWVGGRLKRWQRLVLPFQTALVMSTGLSCGLFGAGYLLTAPPGWSAPNEIAFAGVAIGGLLLGFGLSRLLAAVLIVHVSGLWAAPRWAWNAGVAIIVAGTLAHAAYSIESLTRVVPWI